MAPLSGPIQMLHTATHGLPTKKKNMHIIYCNLITLWTAAIHLLRPLAISGGKITIDINLEKRTQIALKQTRTVAGMESSVYLAVLFSGKKPMHVQEQSETHGKH